MNISAFNKFTSCISNIFPTHLIADALLHPAEFATVLLHLGYNFEVSNVSDKPTSNICVHEAMESSRPNIIHAMSFVINKEGFLGLYRGILPRLCERFVFFNASKLVEWMLTSEEQENRKFGQEYGTFLADTATSHFLPLILSHPLHVITIKSFGEILQDPLSKSSTRELIRDILHHGIHNFFIGLAARLIGALVSVVFCTTYSHLLLKISGNDSEIQNLIQQPRETQLGHSGAAWRNTLRNTQNNISTYYQSLLARVHPRWLRNLLNTTPFSTMDIYGVMIRDYIARTIAHPFDEVCEAMIINNTGWEKLSLLPNWQPLIDKLWTTFKPT